jgi:2-(1,2-epoxy-1,2-dihydrophenyl)acetyl-CoA isomerase
MDCLQVDIQDEVAWVVLNRPHVGNAIDQVLVLALDDALTQVQHPNNRVRCLVLTGEGKNFCSGIDLQAMQVPRADDRTPRFMSRSFLDHLIKRMVTLPIPVVVAVNRVAAGAGMTIALIADVVVMAQNSSFVPSFVRLGMVPDHGICDLLSRAVGAARARSVLMLGNSIDALTSSAWGLAYQAVAPEELRTTAAELARRLALGPRCVLSETRKLLTRNDSGEFRRRLSAERGAHSEAIKACEHLEGFAAFFEYRQLIFCRSSSQQN